MEPERISTEHNFGVTPFGVYCLECNAPVGNVNEKKLDKSLRMHIKRKQHKIDGNVSYVELAKKLKNSISTRFGQVENYDPWVKVNNIKSYRCSCGTTAKNLWNMNRHIKNMKTSEPKGSDFAQ